MLTDNHGLTELGRLGARSVPVLSRGDEWIFAQNLGHVVKFLGLDEHTGPVLSPSQLMERMVLFVQTAIHIVPQMPDALMLKEVPNRPRTYLALAHHLFRIPEGMLEVAAGATLTNDMLTGGPGDQIRSGTALALYGQDVLAALHTWWDLQADNTAQHVVQTYYGPQLLHELMERTTWHCGQHVRQWFMLLEMARVVPAVLLNEQSFHGLPMPKDVWDG